MCLTTQLNTNDAQAVRMQEKVAALPSPKRLPSARLLEAGLRAGRREALPISPPALVSGILMHVISETGH